MNRNARITTNAKGVADAGNINLQIADSIRLRDGSVLSTESSGGGGGAVEILVNDLLYLQDSNITTNVSLGGGNGGNIFVDPVLITLDKSSITANAVDGNGGNITLIADYILQSADSRITASSQLGIDGEIDIQALDADVNKGEDNLTADFLDASQWTRRSCAQTLGSDVSSFIINARPLRPSPYDIWSPSPMDDDLVSITEAFGEHNSNFLAGMEFHTVIEGHPVMPWQDIFIMCTTGVITNKILL